MKDLPEPMKIVPSAAFWGVASEVPGTAPAKKVSFQEASTIAGSSPTPSTPPSPRSDSDIAPPPGLTPLEPGNVQIQTTVIMRNLSLNLSQDQLITFLDQQGFQGRYDFVYLPTDFGTRLSFGYAFINALSCEDACCLIQKLDGFMGFDGKVCSVAWGMELQGLEPHVERYRNSPLMHDSVPEVLKPAIFASGERVSFPPPTKNIRKPRAPRVHRQQMRFAAMQST